MTAYLTRWFVVAAAAGVSTVGYGAPPTLSSEAPAAVHEVKVLPDKAPDCTSLKSIVDSVTRGAKSNDEKAVAIYNFMNLSHYHLAYPNEPGGIPALKEINCYGWSLCGGLHSTESALWRELGWGWRFVGWSTPGHTTVEAQYDGRWHYLDIFLKFYAWMPDGKGGRTIAGEGDLKEQTESLLTQGMVLDKGRGCVYAKDNAFVSGADGANWQAPAFLSCGDTVAGIVSGVNSRKGSGSSTSWSAIHHATGGYSTDVVLAPGYAIENTWDAQTNAWYWQGKSAPRHTCPGHKDTRNDPAYGLVLEPYIDSKPARGYGNGTLTFAPDLGSPAILESFVATSNVRQSGKSLVAATAGLPASVTFSLETPYILTRAGGEAVGADTVEVSTDGGATFGPVEVGDFTMAVRGKMAALVKVTFRESLSALKVRAVFQNNPGALPFLSPGRNKVSVSTADPAALGPNELVVTYAYRLGARTKSFNQLCDQGKEIARQHNAKWSDTVTVVTKRFKAKDLPGTMQIDCPTPKGQYPVYPRMVFLRREVVAPGGQPQPWPDGAVEAQACAEAELVTLPNPFLIGAEPPVPQKARSVMTTRIPLTYGQFSNDKGEVGSQGPLRWPKMEAEQGKVIAAVVTVTGNVQVPARLAAARLVVPVKAGHDKARLKLGAVALKSDLEPGKPVDLKTLPDPVGTCVVPMQPAATPQYRPPKACAIDVTRALRAIAAGEAKFHGFGLRVVPDRGVDDGWTVRCDLAPDGEYVLEIDTYAD